MSNNCVRDSNSLIAQAKLWHVSGDTMLGDKVYPVILFSDWKQNFMNIQTSIFLVYLNILNPISPKPPNPPTLHPMPFTLCVQDLRRLNWPAHIVGVSPKLLNKQENIATYLRVYQCVYLYVCKYHLLPLQTFNTFFKTWSSHIPSFLPLLMNAIV